MQYDGFDTKSIQGYGVNGALGLLMGIGAGSIASIFVNFIMSIAGFKYGIIYQQVILITELTVLFVIYHRFSQAV